MNSKPAQLSAPFDIVVVGAGMAGNAAALSAAETGAKVCLLEKGDQFGGSSLQSGGALAFAGTDMQAGLGIRDSADLLRQDLLLSGGGKCDPEVVEAYIDHQLETFNWLRAHGAEFTLTPPAVAGKINRMHAAPQGQAVRALHSRVLDHPNIVYRCNAAATRLLRTHGQRVEGVQVEISGERGVILANRGVVLASGGFVHNKALLETFAPQWTGAVKMGGRHNTGDGLLMACAMGAGLADMAYVEASLGASLAGYPDLSDEPGDNVSLLFPMMRGAIIVNLEARRFCNEALNYKTLGALAARQTRGVAFQVFDEKVMSRSAPNPGPSNYRGAREKGLLRQAGSVQELAQMLELDAAALHMTVERYNVDVAQGRDVDFDRPIVDYGTSGNAAIDTAPFYAFPCGVALTSTYCGIRVDRQLRVRDVFGEAIPALYAAGEIIGGFHGASYMSGTALAKAAVHGRAAGLSCANNIPDRGSE